MADRKVYKVDKFLGLNEQADSETELKLGEAANINNFYITNGYNLKRRPGVVQAELPVAGEDETIMSFHTGTVKGKPWSGVLKAKNDGTGAVFALNFIDRYGNAEYKEKELEIDAINYPVKAFYMGSSLWIVGRKAGIDTPEAVLARVVFYGTEANLSGHAHIPLVVTGASPSGGGSELDNVNILTTQIQLKYNGDGETKKYVLPDYVVLVDEYVVGVDGAPASGRYDAKTHTFTFDEPPAKGVNNVSFLAFVSENTTKGALEKFLNMKHTEAYNGSTDSRIFFYGDGTNVCYYSGIVDYEEGLYIPLGNEIAADLSATAITGMTRHYSKLIGFQEDGAFEISYSPVTLADGRVIAGFYMHPLSREIGNEMDNQVQTVGNYPRTLHGGTLYEWRTPSGYYNDERYAKPVSEKVCRILAAADPGKVVTVDDNENKTYYMFLNDRKGTVLVNRYELDVWTRYTGTAFQDVRFASAQNGVVMYATGKKIYAFDEDADYDLGEPISASWESGYMAFGADNRRKYSSQIWLSLLPEAGAELYITAQTDRREQYLNKQASFNLMDFGRMDFSKFTFLTRTAPQMKRMQLKVKKFVYYKLIFRVTTPGARATILGYDQQVRFSSNVK